METPIRLIFYFGVKQKLVHLTSLKKLIMTWVNLNKHSDIVVIWIILLLLNISHYGSRQYFKLQPSRRHDNITILVKWLFFMCVFWWCDILASVYTANTPRMPGETHSELCWSSSHEAGNNLLAWPRKIYEASHNKCQAYVYIKLEYWSTISKIKHN